MEKKDVLIYVAKLRSYCSKETCYPRDKEYWVQENPFFGHSAIIAICVYERFGGKICRGIINGSKECHYYNEIDDEIYDLTKEQYGKDVEIIFENYKIKKEMLKNKNFKERHAKFVDKLRQDFVV
jgi:hypothetical protein